MTFAIVLLVIWNLVLTAWLVATLSYCLSLYELVNSVWYFLNKMEMDRNG